MESADVLGKPAYQTASEREREFLRNLRQEQYNQDVRVVNQLIDTLQYQRNKYDILTFKNEIEVQTRSGLNDKLYRGIQRERLRRAQ